MLLNTPTTFHYIAVVILFAFFMSIPYIGKYLFSKIGNMFYFIKFSEQNRIVSKHIKYYNKLNKREKKKFLIRINNFISDFEFEGRSGFKITNEVKILISACAAQITFGQNEFRLPKVNKILVYPRAYNFNNSGIYHKGALAPGGILAISWQDFIEGFSNNSDKINVGLHEFAHAFHLNIITTNEYDFYQDNLIKDFETIAQKEFSDIKNKEHFLREYAGENIFEFFAVAVEHFFEQPYQFKTELPDVYKSLSLVLNQDPANNINRGRRRITPAKIKAFLFSR